MAPKSKTPKRAQKGGDDLDTKLQHAVTTLNELAASLGAVLESRGASVPAAEDAPVPAEVAAAEDSPAPAEDTPAAQEETKEGGGGKKAKKTTKKAVPKKK